MWIASIAHWCASEVTLKPERPLFFSNYSFIPLPLIATKWDFARGPPVVFS